MIYLKSLLAGLLAVVAVLVAVVTVAILVPIVYNATHPLPDGTRFAWDRTDVSVYLSWPPVWPIVFLSIIFFAAFFWKYRRLAKS